MKNVKIFRVEMPGQKEIPAEKKMHWLENNKKYSTSMTANIYRNFYA